MSVTLIGFDEFRADMLRLSKGDMRNVARKSLRAGAKVMQAAIVQAAPVMGGAVAKGRKAKRLAALAALGGGLLPAGSMKGAIKVRSGGRSRSRISVTVGIQGGQSPFTGERGMAGFYPPYIEHGHKIGKRNRLVRAAGSWKKSRAETYEQFSARRKVYIERHDTRTRSVPPHPFVGPAWDSHIQAAWDAMLNVAWPMINNALYGVKIDGAE